MKSPFPGMDPYLERHWLDVHTRLVGRASEALNRLLPDDLVARSEERLAIESEEPLKTRTVFPDVRVFQPGASEPSEGGIAVQAPFKLVVDLEPATERFIRIIGADDEQLITIIEFISPTNKIGKGLEKYLQRREELLESGVHVVEIDLVRQGNWSELLLPHRAPREARATYRATVRMGGHPEIAYLYPMSIRHPLPPIPIPLRPNDPQVQLDLQRLVNEVYETGRYSRTLDYSKPPVPELDPEEAGWAAEAARSAAKH